MLAEGLEKFYLQPQALLAGTFPERHLKMDKLQGHIPPESAALSLHKHPSPDMKQQAAAPLQKKENYLVFIICYYWQPWKNMREWSQDTSTLLAAQ